VVGLIATRDTFGFIPINTVSGVMKFASASCTTVYASAVVPYVTILLASQATHWLPQVSVHRYQVVFDADTLR
jgi:hypothetical protein